MKILLMHIVFVIGTTISLASFGLDQQGTPSSLGAKYWAIFGGDEHQSPDEEQWEASVLVFMLGIFIALGPHTSPTK